MFDNDYSADDWEAWVYSNGMLSFRTASNSSDVRLNVSGLVSARGYCATVVWNPTVSYLYLDGALVATDPANLATRPAPMSLNIAGLLNTRFDGTLPLFAMYYRDLSASEVSDLYDSTRGSLGS